MPARPSHASIAAPATIPVSRPASSQHVSHETTPRDSPGSTVSHYQKGTSGSQGNDILAHTLRGSRFERRAGGGTKALFLVSPPQRGANHGLYSASRCNRGRVSMALSVRWS